MNGRVIERLRGGERNLAPIGPWHLSGDPIQVIDDHAADENERPLFLYLAYPAPHTPWLPGSEFAGTSEAGMYGDFVSHVDAEVGRVLAALDDAGMSDNTLVIFTSDNGPVWYPADVERFGHNSSGGFRGMKADAWEAGHRMPFIVRWPGKVEPASTSDQLICFTDVMATLRCVETDSGTGIGRFYQAWTQGARRG